MIRAYREASRVLVLAWCLLAGHVLATDVGSTPLIDQDGREFRLDSLRGRVVLLVFGFTHCPHICPVEMARVSAALDELALADSQVTGLFLTVDPQRDTPAVIKSYIESFHPGIVGATGSPQALDEVAGHYRVRREKQVTQDGGYLIEHGYSLYILDQAGVARVAVLPGLPPSHIASLVRDLLQR